jgi:propionyl-CoA carboxylase alpha chain
VGSGDEIGTFYDAMIAKVIVWAPTRDQALRQLAGSLQRAEIHGLTTNRDLLVKLLRDPVVVSGQMHTTYLDTVDLAPLAAGPGGEDALALSGLAAAVTIAERARIASPHQSRIPAGWRNVVSQPQVTTFLAGGEELVVRWYGGRSFRSADRDDVAVLSAEGVDADTHCVALEVAGVARTFVVHVRGTEVDIESSLGHVALAKQPRFVDPADQVATGSLLAPMPGSVISVQVATGDTVTAGQTVLVLEAMKMQHTVSAPHDGVVTEIDVAVGQQVEAGAVLAVVEGEADNESEGSDS